MAGFENDVMFAKNADFTKADNQNVSESNGLATNGQLWIGRTSLNAGGTHIDVGTLTGGTGISITNGAGSITIATSGSSVGNTITGDSGGALSPTAGNWNILGGTNLTTVGSASTLTANLDDPVRLSNNSASNPSYSFASATDAGMFLDGSGRVALATGGSAFLYGNGFNLTVASSNTYMQYLTMQSGWSMTYTQPGAYPYTATAFDIYISVDSSIARTINLPNAPTTDRIFIVKDRTGSAGTNNITVTTPGGVVTIDGSTSYVMNNNYQEASFLFNGTSYEVFASSNFRDLHTARYIVSAGGAANGANYTTISTAITAAVAATGVQTIAIQPGTYTENFTLPANINLVAYDADPLTPNVTIVGKISMASGTASCSGIRFTTNSDNSFAISGTAILYLTNCYINASTTTAIAHSSSGSVNLYYCQGTLGTTGIALFTMSAGSMVIEHCNFLNAGDSTTANTASGSSSLYINYSQISNPITTSNTAILNMNAVIITATNTTVLTVNGTGQTLVSGCDFSSGTASAISVGTGATLVLTRSTVSSSNTNAITGAGTLTFTALSFISSSVVNTTTQTALYTQLGKYKASGQPAFLASLSGTASNVTGDGTTFTIGTGTAFTKISDQDTNFNTNGTFTAPVTGLYHFDAHVSLLQSASATDALFQLITSNSGYNSSRSLPGSISTFTMLLSQLADMDAADTATLAITVSGITKIVDIDNGNRGTCFAGNLAC